MAQPRRGFGARPIADLVDICLDRTLAAQGFAGSDVIASWAEIVGERLALVSQPMKMDWPRRGAAAARGSRPEPACLVVRVEGVFALELQHMAPVIVERVNAHYGWRCVGRLVLKQGPVRRAAKPALPEFRLSAAEQGRVGAATCTIEAKALRGALDRLGTAIVATERRGDAET